MSSREPLRDLAGAPPGLRPELVPGIEVLKVLPAVSHLAILELEDDAVGNVEVLAVSVRGAALHTDHAVLAIRRQVLQLSPEGPSSLLGQLAEVRQGRPATLVVPGHRAPARQVPHSLVHELGERVHIARVERVVSATHGRYVLLCGHRDDSFATETLPNHSAIEFGGPTARPQDPHYSSSASSIVFVRTGTGRGDLDDVAGVVGDERDALIDRRHVEGASDEVDAPRPQLLDRRVDVVDGDA